MAFAHWFEQDWGDLVAGCSCRTVFGGQTGLADLAAKNTWTVLWCFLLTHFRYFSASHVAVTLMYQGAGVSATQYSIHLLWMDSEKPPSAFQGGHGTSCL